MKMLTKKSIIGLIIVLIMIMNLVPFGAISQVYATTDYDLWIGGTRVTSENLSGEGWTYNPSNNILTLDNYNYSSATASIDEIRAGIYSKNDIVINLIGTNIINEMSENSLNSFGILVDWNSSTKLTFKGNGVLTSSGTTTSNTTGYSNCGIAAGELVLDKDFTGTINANGGTSSASNAMATMGIYTKSLTVNSGTLNALGGTASDSYASSSGIFMGAPATININGGTVNTYGGTGGVRGQSVGLWMYGEYEGDTGTIVVKRNATLSAKGSNAQLSYGINFENSNGGSINISSGANVTCWSTNTSTGNSMGDVYSCGLRTDGNSLTSMGNLTVYTEGTSTRTNDTVCAISGGNGSYSIYQGKGYTDAAGTEGETILQTNGVTSSLMSYKCIVTISEPIVYYNLWVGATQVTSANKDDVLGDGKVTYNPTTHTLDFDDVTINDYHIQWDNDKVGIFSLGIDNLTITGKVNIPSTDLWASIGVYSETSSKINCNFNGDITVAKQILIQGNLAIIGGSLTKTINGTAIYANGSLTIESNVTKIDVMSYIYAEDGITIEASLIITSPEWLTITNGETTSMGGLSAYDTTRIVIEHPLPSTHTVTFNLNGGTMTGDTSVVVNDGETVAQPNPAPTKDGNTFGGWYADSLFNTPFDFTTPITTDDVQIYAKWIENSPQTTPINILNITINSPTVGTTATNSTQPNVIIDENAGYELDFTAFVTAYPSEMPSGYDEQFIGTFESNHSYYVEVSLHALNGYVFRDNSNMTLKVNGKTTGYEMSEWNADGSTYYMFWAKIDVNEENPEPTYKVTYDFNGGNRHGESKYVTTSVGFVPIISVSNFIDWMEVTAPNGKELDAIEINGVRYELGSYYELNKDTTYKYLWKTSSSHKHTYSTTTTKATVSKDGSIVVKCSCGDVKSSTIIPKIKTVKLSKTSFKYNKKVQKPTVTIKDSKGKTLKEGTDYTIKYSNKKSKKVGEYTVTITFKGNYTGSKKITYQIKPKGVSISKLTKGKKQFKATWGKNTTETTGYQIQYSTKNDFSSGNKTTTIKKNKTTSTTVKKLKNKKKYYVRIRTYKTVNGKKIYSNWSKVLNVKTK